jgi:GNAT-like C-terminal domain/N-acyltransferase N-terminal domain
MMSRWRDPGVLARPEKDDMADQKQSTVMNRLGLDDKYDAWLERLQEIGPAQVTLSSGGEATSLLQRLGVTEPDLSAIADALPSPDSDPELWWLLERAVNQVRRDVGQWDAPIGPRPGLPAELGVTGRCFWIFVYLAAVDDVRRWHQQRGVPDDVSWRTLGDLGRHIRNYRERTGEVGFDSQFWLTAPFRGALYELGRLQFNPYHLLSGPAGPLFWYDDAEQERLGEGYRKGDPALGTHVPEIGPLTPESVDESFAAVRPFFSAHFPEHGFRVCTCTSWLLDEQLAEYLPPTSGIVRFQSRFTMIPGVREADEMVFRYVFGDIPKSMDDAPQDTELRRAVVAHVRAGKHWNMRTGYVDV